MAYKIIGDTNIIVDLLIEEKITDLLAIFREMCKTINIIPFSKDILYYCLEKDQAKQAKEDEPLYFLAHKAKMNYFITGNVKDCTFPFSSLPVMGPGNFIKEIYLNDIP